MFNFSSDLLNCIDVDHLKNRGTMARMDFWAAQQSVAGTVPCFTGLVVVNLGPAKPGLLTQTPQS
jgi:hypothetical protein